MKVRELIEALNKQDPNAIVIVHGFKDFDTIAYVTKEMVSMTYDDDECPVNPGHGKYRISGGGEIKAVFVQRDS